MEFRTEFAIEGCNEKITYDSRILFTGSCFSENIADRLTEYKFNILSNPSGIIYNPVSLASDLQRMMTKYTVTEEDVFMEGDVWKSFDFHSRISHPDKQTCLYMMQQAIDMGHDFLKKTSHLIVTFGTSRVYENIASGKIVTNNHKQPASLFTRKQLRTAEILQVWEKAIRELREFNPGIKIIFAVSPVRHFRDGAIANTWSKAVLISVVQELCSNDSNLYYFPSYEIVMDDLRDYRFYAGDMLHPNDTAIGYIFEKFKVACIAASEYQGIKEIQEITTAMQHRSFYPGTTQHKSFMRSMLEKAEELKRKYPALDFSEEIKYFQS